MLKVLSIFNFYIHLNYGAPESFTFNFTDMPSSIHLNFNGKPGKSVGPIKPIITVEPDPVEPDPWFKDPGIDECICGIIPEEHGMYPESNRGGDLFLN